VESARDFFPRGTRRSDLILACVGNRPWAALRRALAPGGTCVLAGARPTLGGMLGRWLGALALTRIGRERFVLYVARLRRDDLQAVGDLLASGAVVPVVERRFGLHEVPAALRHLETGRARGKLIVVP
jgi:NADPH:quinone reductase-like Zn-dependent oxidoreductase